MLPRGQDDPSYFRQCIGCAGLRILEIAGGTTSRLSRPAVALRRLGQARSFRIMAGDFATGGAREKSGSEMAGSMRLGASRGEIGDQGDAE
jgi:hypothetical protein